MLRALGNEFGNTPRLLLASLQVNRGVGSSIPSGSADALVSRFVTATASENLAENACGVEETRVAITNTATQTRR
jgi:hypothetical protein